MYVVCNENQILIIMYYLPTILLDSVAMLPDVILLLKDELVFSKEKWQQLARHY